MTGSHRGGPLEIKLDEKFLPADDGDRRQTQYDYTLEEKLDAVIELEVDDDPDGKLALVDIKRAYATLVAGVDSRSGAALRSCPVRLGSVRPSSPCASSASRYA